MKSGKQRRAELTAERRAKEVKRVAKQKSPAVSSLAVPVNYEALAPNNSYSGSDFMRCGYYTDQPFRCIDCDKDEVWTASQQKWWFEVAKGYIFSQARRCRNCRRKERERRNESRRVHLEGLERRRLKTEAARETSSDHEE